MENLGRVFVAARVLEVVSCDLIDSVHLHDVIFRFSDPSRQARGAPSTARLWRHELFSPTRHLAMNGDLVFVFILCRVRLGEFRE